jgi:nicotinamide mononucleotide transporter
MDGWLQSIGHAAFSMSLWEGTAVMFAIAYLLLAVKENVWCWFFAFISTALYTALFWDVNLLMDSALNVYYMAMAVFGWYQWTRGGHGDSTEPHTLAIQSLDGRQHGFIIVAILLLSSVSGYLLSEHSNAAWPYVDSFTTWASVITTYLVTRKYLQNWLYWIVIDAVSVPLYIERGLNLTALLFAIYIIIAVFGYMNWHKHYRDSRQVVAA